MNLQTSDCVNIYSMNCLRKLTLLLSLLLGIAGTCLAQTAYDQPFLGEWPKGYRAKYAAEVWQHLAANDLATVVKQSDLILVGTAETLTELKSQLDKDTIEFYEGDIKPTETLKGKPDAAKLHLKFAPSAVGLAAGARHLFFIKQAGAEYEVLKACFLYPEGEGYDNRIRLIDHIDCSTDLALDTIRYLVNGKIPPNYEKRLMAEFMNENYMFTLSAAHMAAAAPAAGMAVLKLAVSGVENRKFDTQIYGIAAHALARHNQPESWRVLLESIPNPKGFDNIAEAIAFDLLAVMGSDKTLPTVQAVIAKHPNFAVSAAFALSRMGTKDARAALETWIANPALATRTINVPPDWATPTADWMAPTLSYGFLFKQALEKMGKWEK